MRKIVLDTNFLIYCAKFRVDFFSEIDRICLFQYKLYITESVINELERLKPKNLNLIKKYIQKLEVIKSEGTYADDELVELSKQGYIVATNDIPLKKRLTRPIITIRQKKYLQLA
jgi:rRNA-processing protein FCF1